MYCRINYLQFKIKKKHNLLFFQILVGIFFMLIGSQLPTLHHTKYQIVFKKKKLSKFSI